MVCFYSEYFLSLVAADFASNRIEHAHPLWVPIVR